MISKRKSLGALVLKLVFAIPLWVLLDLGRAYVLFIMWGWFMIPAFGITTPPLMALWGVLLMVHTVLYRRPSPEEEDESLGIWAARSVTISLTILSMALLIKTLGGL